MALSSTEMTRALRSVASQIHPASRASFLKDVGDAYAEAVGVQTGLVDQLTSGGINEQAYELAGHASRRSGIGGMNKLAHAAFAVAKQYGVVPEMLLLEGDK